MSNAYVQHKLVCNPNMFGAGAVPSFKWFDSSADMCFVVSTVTLYGLFCKNYNNF